ncbi:hypothetical protein ONJ16_27810, partial [Salmonella enterica subsp. enterica serovar Montevideo]|nr:hypothetical protein [Salmonella enterica subsp. enterica serovar Montevideo]
VCIKLKCWKIIPIRCRAWRNAFPSSAEISTPLTLTRPWLGRVSAYEAADDGLNMTWAPMVDVSRDPRWGRASEGFGEDTYL